MANEPIGGLRIQLSAENAKLIQDLGKARKNLNQFNREAGTGAAKLSGQFQSLGKVFAAVFVSGVIGRAIQNVTKLGDELSKMSQRTGLTVEFLNGLTQAAGVADVSQESLAKGIKTLNKNLLDMTQGTGEAKDSFKAMGISAADASQLLKTPEDSLLKILDLISKIPDVSRRGAVAQELLGRAGVDWLPLINQGTDAIKRQIEEFQRLRPITTEQAQAAERFNDSLTTLTFAFEGLVQKGIGPLLPGITDLVEVMTSLVALDYANAADRLGTLQSTFGTFVRGIAGSVVVLNAFAETLLRTFEFMGQVSENIGNLASLDEKKGLFQLPAIDTTQFDRTKAQLKAKNADIANIRKDMLETLGRIFPEATGGKPKDFSPPPKAPIPIDTLEPVKVSSRLKSSELSAQIALNEAKVKAVELEEKDLEIKSDRVNILNEEQALLKEALAIQKEIEDANKEGKERGVDENVILAARIEKETRLQEIQNERIELAKKLTGEEQELLGADIQHGLNIEHQTQQQGILNQFTKEQGDLQRAIAKAGDDTAQVRAGQILLIESRVNLLKKENETLGETKVRNEEIRNLLLDINAIKEEGNRIEQEGLGRGIVQAGSADLERQLADKQRAVRDAEQQVELGSISRGQTIHDQKVREIQLIDAKLALLQKEQALGLITTEQADNQTEILVTQFSNASNPRGFLEGWQDAFKQFTNDAEGAFGLGQTLARQFTQNVQQLGASITQNVFNKLEEGTLTWRSALETIPDILQQITSQLIGMAIAQGVASAIGGGLGGLFGGGAPGATPNATARGALNPNLFGPGFASGADFMVGGRGGVDANFFPMRLSKGERVRIDTPAQQREGRGGDLTVNIFNTAGADVQQHERQTPNGSVLDVMITRRVRKVNREEFGLANKPGRVG